MTMLSTSEAGSGAELPARVQTYIDALVRTCTEDRTPLVSVILFGSAVKSGFSWGVSDVDLIIVVPDDASRAMRRRLGEAVARLETFYGCVRSRPSHPELCGRASSGRWGTGSPALSAREVT